MPRLAIAQLPMYGIFFRHYRHSYVSKNMEKHSLQGPAGTLEAIIHRVSGSTKWAVVCHPHPLFGGTLNNKVVTTVAKLYESLGINVVRFNFRGVGSSEGEYGEGLGETLDALAVLRYVQEQEQAKALYVAGFSFGSYVAAQATYDLANQANACMVEHLALIAPSVENFSYPDPLVCPTTVVIAEEDEVVDADAGLEWAENLYPPVEVLEMEGASHFFHGQLIELRDRLKESISDHI